MQQDLARNFNGIGKFAPLSAWITCPGYVVATKMRVMHAARRYGPLGKLFSRLVWRNIVQKHACYIAMTAKVGPGLKLPHPVAVVIGEGSRIGSNVTIFQNVTLGVRNARLLEYPVIEDDVTIFTNAVLIGGITVGRGATVGAGAIVIENVPPGAVVKGPGAIGRTLTTAQTDYAAAAI